MTSHEKFRAGDALLIVDVQNDFFPGGALPVQDADAIVPVVNEWIAKSRDHAVPVYASRDWHPAGHVSFSREGGKWPPHCIQDSDGALFHPELKLPGDARIITKGVRFDHDQNSAFDETGLETHLKKEGIRRLFVCGLALDVCVRDSVMDAVGAGFQVVLITEATRPVDATAAADAAARMQEAGVTMSGPSPREELSGSSGAADGGNGMPEPDFCVKAPEWAEHERLHDSDTPCDDGRSGTG